MKPRHPARAALLAITAIAPALAGLVASPASATSDAASTFTLPDHPVVLTREVRRPLPDGSEIVTRRSFALSIARHPKGSREGWRVDGTQIACDVTAPAHLSALAAIEKSRKETGLFPLFVDRHGMLMGGVARSAQAASGHPLTATGRAVKDASGRIAVSALSPGERDEAQAFIDALRQGRALVEVPHDLFRPSPGLQSQTRQLPLGDGTTGAVTITSEAATQAGGLLAWRERTVVTELGGTREESRETWRLEEQLAAK